MDIKFDVSLYSEVLGTLYKDNEIDLDGLEAKVDLNLDEVNGMAVNFEVGGKSYTDYVEIKDRVARTVQIPFKTSVLKAGNNSFELVATMKNGDVKTSRTYAYQIVKSLENPNAVEADTHYPILIDLINQVSAITANGESGGESSGHTHHNKTVLDGITSSKVNEWNNKADKTHTHSQYLTALPTHNHSYNDLSDKPVIPSTEGLATESYVQAKIAEASLSGGEVDLSDYYTKSEVDNKDQAIDDKITVLNNDLTQRYTNSEIDLKISEMVLESGNVVFRDVYAGEIFTVYTDGVVIPPIITYGNLIVSATSLTMNEKSTTAFTVKLDQAPTSDQIVTVSVNNNYCTVDKSVLTFTPNNYSTPQTITVTGVCDSTHYSDKTSVIVVSSSNVSNQTVAVTIKNIDEQPSTVVNVTSVSLDKTTHTLKVGENIQLTATVLPSNATNKNVVWSANNNNVTVVNGLITAKTKGSSVVTCQTEDGNKTATCQVTIEETGLEEPPTVNNDIVVIDEVQQTVTVQLNTYISTHNLGNCKSVSNYGDTMTWATIPAGHFVYLPIISTDDGTTVLQNYTSSALIASPAPTIVHRYGNQICYKSTLPVSESANISEHMKAINTKVTFDMSSHEKLLVTDGANIADVQIRTSGVYDGSMYFIITLDSMDERLTSISISTHVPISPDFHVKASNDYPGAAPNGFTIRSADSKLWLMIEKTRLSSNDAEGVRNYFSKNPLYVYLKTV